MQTNQSKPNPIPQSMNAKIKSPASGRGSGKSARPPREGVRGHSQTEETRAGSRYTRGLIEASLDPLVTISPKGKITDVNKATELVTGVSRENLIGTDFPDYFTE